MKLVGYILLLFSVFSLVCSAKDANAFEPVISYSFSENSVMDDKGNSNLFLRNNAALFNDPERGSVLRFSSGEKSYAVFDQQLLNTDSLTISFYFYWEEQGAGAWHQLFEVYDKELGSNLFFTTQTSWGSKGCALISQNKNYGTYETVNTAQVPKNKWIHFTITFKQKEASIFIDGELASKGYLMFPPSKVDGDSLLLGGNPYRSDNYYVSARYDDIKIFNQALSDNQVSALFKGETIPEPTQFSTNWTTSGNPLDIEIDLADKKQTIQNFGSSDGWNTQRIGKYWPDAKKEKLAELLFSAEKDASGNPKGIGLSAWRFNIGAGTAEQGNTSRIHSEHRRTECFLNTDGTYNWNKQIGQQWFFKKAVQQYKIHHLIGWQNSPPVLYTQNNLGFRDYGTPMSTILKTEHFDDFAKFLGDVVKHFADEGFHFDYISPLNEPQYGWSPDKVGGTVSQEGTPWTNQEIHDVVVAINSEFTNRNIDTKLFVTEAGSIHYHTSGTGHASSQLLKFWNPYSSLSLVDKHAFANIVSYHSYWKDYGTALVDERINFVDKAKQLSPVPEAWQTEYSLLGNGYREGYPQDYKLTEMECALSLSKVIMTDLNVTNTTGWQWWSTFGMGKHGGEARFCLIEAFTNNENTDGEYHLNKLFYSLGNFSHFIRPGMNRIGVSRSDNKTAQQQLRDVVFSAYTDEEKKKLVLVAANYTDQAREVNIEVLNLGDKMLRNSALFLTDHFTSLQRQNIDLSNGQMVIPAHAVVTYTADLERDNSESIFNKEQHFRAYHNRNSNAIEIKINDITKVEALQLYSMTGQMLGKISVTDSQKIQAFSTHDLSEGVYVVVALCQGAKRSQKVVVTQ